MDQGIARTRPIISPGYTRMTFKSSFDCNKSSQEGEPCLQPDLDMLSPDYRIGEKLGEGGYGAVYEVIDSDHRRLAIKMQKKSERGRGLKKEFEIYRLLLLQNCHIPSAGFSFPYEYREYKGLEYLILERLGDSLDSIMKRSPRKQLKKSDVLMIGIQVIKRLRLLHQYGILHRDIKPSNLLMGHIHNTEKTVHVIDFGISTLVQDWGGYAYDEEIDFAGTRSFAPAEAFFHQAPTRKGDLESLVYTLIHLACGKLPWVHFDPDNGRPLNDSELGVQRIRTKPGDLCKDFPELTNFAKVVSRSKRTKEPEYDRLTYLLESALSDMDFVNDGSFQWLKSVTIACEAGFKFKVSNSNSKNTREITACKKASYVTTNHPLGVEIVFLSGMEINIQQQIAQNNGLTDETVIGNRHQEAGKTVSTEDPSSGPFSGDVSRDAGLFTHNERSKGQSLRYAIGVTVGIGMIILFGIQLRRLKT